MTPGLGLELGFGGLVPLGGNSGPAPPSGFVFLYDDDGVTQLTDDDGAFLLDVA